MSSIKQPCHPFEITTISEVLKESPPDLPPGRLYGSFDCPAAISCGGIHGDDPKDIALKVSANTSRNFALVAQNLYSLKLRLVNNPKNATYTGYYTPGQPALLGDPKRVDIDMTNKIVSDSFGLIIKRAKIPASTSGEGDTTLSCTIRHTNWDSEVNSVSVSTGHKATKDISVMNQPSPQQNSNRKRRLVNLIPSNPSKTGSSSSSGNSNSSLCHLHISKKNNNNAISSSSFATFDDDIPHIKVEKEVHPITESKSEQGEITEPSNLPSQNTHAQKCTQSSVLSDAQKRLKKANR
ncbi:hypothetical protein O181_061906 [Austropuccinia psidii MF-1]|uniref:Uncharacterized protein n=1 Tax=Austropuccinia psidii MF-1 TaxID=1389203 RepID=A0A9Q3HY04_9BASI|nr:hypothetical protein [Austropuccinia psidii MF-1]